MLAEAEADESSSAEAYEKLTEENTVRASWLFFVWKHFERPYGPWTTQLHLFCFCFAVFHLGNRSAPVFVRSVPMRFGSRQWADQLFQAFGKTAVRNASDWLLVAYGAGRGKVTKATKAADVKGKTSEGKQLEVALGNYAENKAADSSLLCPCSEHPCTCLPSFLSLLACLAFPASRLDCI